MHAFAALSDPTRRRIVELLSAGERAAGEIVDEFDVSAPAISQHLKALRDAGLVRVRVDAQRRIYALDPSGFDDVHRWLQGVRAFWADRLDALEAALSLQQDAPKPSPTRRAKRKLQRRKR